METVQLPLLGPAYTGVKKESLTDGAFKKVNWITTVNNTLIQRPAIKYLAYLQENHEVKGVYYWRAKKYVVILTANPTDFGDVRMYTFDAATGTQVTSNTFLPWSYDRERYTSWAEDDDTLYLAQGQRILSFVQDIPSGGLISTVIGGSAPTDATRISYLDGYLIASGKTNRWYFSNLLDPLTWNPLDFATAAGADDIILAHHVAEREIHFFGTHTIEIWQNDGTNPFSRIPGGFLEIGLLAEALVAKSADGEFYFLDNQKRFVKLKGRSFQVIPCPFIKDIQQLSAFAGAYAYAVTISGVEVIVFTFPDISTTYTYNLSNGTWEQWGEWYSKTSEYLAFRGSFAQRTPVSANVYCGISLYDEYTDEIAASPITTQYPNYAFLGTLDVDVGKDELFVIPGSVDIRVPVRPMIESGNLDFGTQQVKRSKEIRVTMFRGAATENAELEVSFNPDGKGWSIPRRYSLGNTGDLNNVIRIQRTGSFRSRQYRFVVLGGSYTEIVRIEEDVEVLGR